MKLLLPYSRLRYLVIIVVIALVYYASAYVGLQLSFQKTNATPVWPPSGIALAAIIIYGSRVWPGIILGAFAINVTVFLSNGVCNISTAICLSAVISIGNTAEALLGYFLLKKHTLIEKVFNKTRSVFRFVMIALIVCLSSSIIGSLTVCFGTIVNWNYFFAVWYTWFLGDVSAILVITPLVVLLANFSILFRKWFRIIEIVLLYVIVFLLSQIIFNDWAHGYFPIQISYLLLPLLLWIAFRFDQLEVLVCILISSCVAIHGTMQGNGPFESESLNRSLLSLQGYLCVISVTFLTLSAIIKEKRAYEKELLIVQNELRSRVSKRTVELKSKQFEIAEFQNRMEHISNVLLEYTQLDFSKKVFISDKRDEIDAIAAGLNALSDELEYYINKLRESEERYRTIVENVKDYAIFMLDPNGFVISWNAGAKKLTGYKADEIIGKHFTIFNQNGKKGVDENHLELAREFGRVEYEEQRIRKNGTLFWANIVLTVIYDNSMEIIGFSKIARDITERKNSEMILKQKSEELVNSNKELEQFAYVASHDLQEPLRTISSYVQLLERRYKGKFDADADEFISFAIDGCNRMRGLIHSLLEYARVNRVKPFEKVSLDEILDEVLRDLKNHVKESDAIIKRDPLPELFCDRVLIGLLFQNLIGNALKFKREERTVITISFEEKEGMYLFKIADNGIGIEKEYLTKVFEIFQRLFSREKYPGTGIGLSICKKIVEKHNGKIWVESEIGRGSVFYFTLMKVH